MKIKILFQEEYCDIWPTYILNDNAYTLIKFYSNSKESTVYIAF